MLKNFTFIAVLLIGFSFQLFSQTIVSTDPENRNVVLEEFTGIYCGFCPDGHAIAQGIYDANPDDVVLVNIHVGGFAAPTGNDPDYRTQWGAAIDGQADVGGYPAGTVNRHLFQGWSQGSGTAMSRGQWSGAADIVMADPSYLNVGVEGTIITSTRQLAVNVEVYYTGDSPVSSNFLTVAILQNDVIGYQSSGGSNYQHMHMLRHFLTGQWGEEITQTSEGTLYTTTLYYEIPEDIRDIEVVLEDLDIVAYVAEGHQEIISGSKGEITFIESLDIDAGIVDSNIPQTSCGEEMNAAITIKNFGGDNLTSLDFEYSVNDEGIQTYTWAGDLAQHETESVTLPSFEIDASASNTFNVVTVNPNNTSDELPANNDFTTDFDRTAYLPQGCKIAILTDTNPEETTWDIKNSSGDVVASGGPYTISSIFIEDFTWPENDCYTFSIYDAGSDGLNGGFYKLLNSSSQVIWVGNSEFGSVAAAEFAYDELMDISQMPINTEIDIYPNPIIETAQVEFSLLEQSTVVIDIYNILGKKIVNVFNSKLAQGQQNIDIRTDNLESGIYFVNVNINGIYTSKKVTVIK